MNPRPLVLYQPDPIFQCLKTLENIVYAKELNYMILQFSVMNLIYYVNRTCNEVETLMASYHLYCVIICNTIFILTPTQVPKNVE